ncbi:ATP-binding protein [Vulcanisaeta distributa]|uniref:ATP-binding protein n=1 Tax=Vulcanisaeta distributa TaxID=164451 RepID=UPI00069CB2FD|nr:ATP-binding protein [Vulcanisaeta distributa]
MGRVRLGFANLTIEFVDRDLALKLIDEWAEKSTFPVQVIYGPEGCGKTAWLLQSVELLRDYGFEVVYVNPINRLAFAEVSISSLREEFFKLVKEAIAQSALARIAWIAYNVVYDVIKATRGKIAIIVDDAFQVIGIKESALYVKALLNLIEYPPEHYERIVTIAATSEGVSRREIGRHTWAWIIPMWNMPKNGFKQLYDQIPGKKPDLEEVWRLTGGNPRMLEELYKANWDADRVIGELIKGKGVDVFVSSLSDSERRMLARAVEDPDVLFTREGIPLMSKLIELNLVLDISDRKPYLWIDQPPPEKDEELGIGRRVAWQSPLHREAVRRMLEAQSQ